jgi:NAD(P)-dependent dehydrogenase (short-subunit alcohol dehydrogenase family)
MSKLRSSVAVVTGGASGIGRALCVEIARRGGKVVVADIERERAEQVAAELRAGGADAIAAHCDVTDRASLEAVRDACIDRYGKVNLLCNNAGVLAAGTVEGTREHNMRWLYEVNVFGVVHGLQVFLPQLREAAGRGEFAHVLNTGSENSLGVPPAGPCSVYTSTKHALLGLSDTLRRDLDGSGIGVTLVCPAVVNTDLWNATRNRPETLGGPRQAAAAMAGVLQQGNTPESVALAALDGSEANEFLVLPHPEVAAFTRKRAQELLDALAACEGRAGHGEH